MVSRVFFVYTDSTDANFLIPMTSNHPPLQPTLATAIFLFVVETSYLLLWWQY